MKQCMNRTVHQVGRVGLVSLLSLLILGVMGYRVAAQPPGDRDAAREGPEAKAKLGLHFNKPEALQGYTLFAPEFWNTTYLIDMDGRVVKTWESDYKPGHSAYLLENGNLLRTGQIDDPEFGFVPGHGGRIQEFTWDGELVWDYKFASDRRLPHHDICRLPNGNVLMIVWEKKTPEEAIAAGRLPESLGGRDLHVDSLLEVKPTGKTTGAIVWEWHLWDHLIQNLDSSKQNYGDVAAHPELVDLNYGEDLIASLVATKDGRDKLRALGYVGNPSPGNRPGRVSSDWTHTNAVDYNAELDQIMLSVHAFSEIWIIDHSTTTEEAAGHTGGRSGQGGDLLYRWGNPVTYRAGTAEDRKLFNQHNAQWIAKGYPGEGHVLIFNNGGRRPGGAYSSVDEIVLPLEKEGGYACTPGKAYGPESPVWSYSAPNKPDFFATFISGAHRLPNGNTFICSGPQGIMFEVRPDKEMVWKYINPVKVDPVTAGGPGRGGPPRPGQVMPDFVQDQLELSDEQRAKLDELQNTVDSAVRSILNGDQQKQWTDIQSGRAFGGGIPRPGEIMSTLLQARLKLTDDQKQQMKNLQTDLDGKLAALLSGDQNKQFEQLAGGLPGPVGRGGGPGGPPPGPRPGPGGMPRGPGGVGGPGSGGPLFRATRYASDFPGLAGRTLTPGETVEQIFTQKQKQAKEGEAGEKKP